MFIQNNKYKLVTKYKPSGDQAQAIEQLNKGILENKKHQVLLGATGTGKTFTIANIIAKHNKQALVIAHNKTLAMQLYYELKEMFPENRVEYLFQTSIFSNQKLIFHQKIYILIKILDKIWN